MSEETGMVSIPAEGWRMPLPHKAHPYSLIIDYATYEDFVALLYSINLHYSCCKYDEYLHFSEVDCFLSRRFNRTKVFTVNKETGMGKWRLPYTNTYPKKEKPCLSLSKQKRC